MGGLTATQPSSAPASAFLLPELMLATLRGTSNLLHCLMNSSHKSQRQSSCYHGIRIQPLCIRRKHPQNPSPLHCQTPSPILIHRHIDTQPRHFTRTPHRNKMHWNSRALQPYNPQTPSTHTNTATYSSARAPFLASLMSMDCSRSEGSGAVRWRRK